MHHYIVICLGLNATIVSDTVDGSIYIELPTGVAVAMIIVITIIINIILSISMTIIHNQHIHITNN